VGCAGEDARRRDKSDAQRATNPKFEARNPKQARMTEIQKKSKQQTNYWQPGFGTFEI
jgi:hypothetical protein